MVFLFLSRSRLVELRWNILIFTHLYKFYKYLVLFNHMTYETFSRILINYFLVNKTAFSTMSYNIFSSKILVHIKYECIRVIRPRVYSAWWCIYQLLVLVLGAGFLLSLLYIFWFRECTYCYLNRFIVF